MGSVVSGAVNSIGGAVQGLTKAFTPQNGTQGQSPLDTAALNNQIATSQQNLANLTPEQQQLSQALLAQSQGQGPNPAQAQLQQNTNQNIQQNAGFIASQKGINPALAARLASQNAANTNQQAAGQAATLGANQQLAAQQQLAASYGQQANQNLQNIQTSGGLANNASLGAQQISAGAAAQNAAANQNAVSGLIGGAASATGLFKSQGGMIQKFDNGGNVENQITAMFQPPTAAQTPVGTPAQQDLGQSASQSIAHQILQAGGVTTYANGMNLKLPVPAKKPQQPAGQTVAGGAADQGYKPTDLGEAEANAGSLSYLNNPKMAFKGGKIPSHLAHVGMIYHPNFQAKGTAALKTKGGGVPGKAEVPGDSPTNDTVETMLSPDEFVVKRSIMLSPNAPELAAKAVADELKKKSKGSPADFKAALKNAISSRKGA